MSISKSQLEVEYQRYSDLCKFTGKSVPLFEEYVVQRGLKLEDYLTEEELKMVKE